MGVAVQLPLHDVISALVHGSPSWSRIALGMILAVSRSLNDPEAAEPIDTWGRPRPPSTPNRPPETPMPDRPLRVLISGGGTGGHPPRAGHRRGAHGPQAQCGHRIRRARGRMEMERVSAAGYTITGLPITGIDRKLSARTCCSCQALRRRG